MSYLTTDPTLSPLLDMLGISVVGSSVDNLMNTLENSCCKIEFKFYTGCVY